MSYHIAHRPNPEFNGYPWHNPSTDPTQYFILLKDDVIDDHSQVWLLWPSREVWLWWKDDEYLIGHAKQAEEDGEPHTWMFDDFEDEILHCIDREEKDLSAFEEYWDRIKPAIDTIINEHALKWMELENPDFGILPSVINYGQGE